MYKRSCFAWELVSYRSRAKPKKRNWLTIPCGLFYTLNLTLPPVCLELTGLLDLLVYVIFVLALWFFEDSKFCYGGSTGFFRGDTSQVWALTTSAWVNIWEKLVTTTEFYKDENFLWSGLYCNRSRHGNISDAITFFIYLCFSLYQEIFFEEIASVMAKFEQILRERFGNISKQSFKNNKNSEIYSMLSTLLANILRKL